MPSKTTAPGRYASSRSPIRCDSRPFHWAEVSFSASRDEKYSAKKPSSRTIGSASESVNRMG